MPGTCRVVRLLFFYCDSDETLNHSALNCAYNGYTMLYLFSPFWSIFHHCPIYMTIAKYIGSWWSQQDSLLLLYIAVTDALVLQYGQGTRQRLRHAKIVPVCSSYLETIPVGQKERKGERSQERERDQREREGLRFVVISYLSFETECTRCSWLDYTYCEQAVVSASQIG